MINVKLHGGFFLRFLLLLVLFLAPWPVVQEGYANFFRGGANALFLSSASRGMVRFSPRPSDGKHDTLFIRKNRVSAASAHGVCSSRHLGYKPTAVVVALILATPLPWSRKWRALLWGLVFVHAFVVLRVTILVLEAFSRNDAVALFELGAAGRKALLFVKWVLVTYFPGTFVAPIPIWFLVCFRKSDWERLLHKAADPPERQHRGS